MQLRKIKNQYMIVEASADNVNMSNVYSLNQTAAKLWELIGCGEYTAEEVAKRLSEIYSIGFDTAIHDVQGQLDKWKSYGLID